MIIHVRRKSFTIVEMMVVIAIVGILMGMMLPALGKARTRAKYVRWLAFNAQNNRDPDTIINYNFEAMDFQAKIKGTYYPVLYNGAIACNAPGYDPAAYNGILSTTATTAAAKKNPANYPQWVRGGGRWMGMKNTLQFNGTNNYVDIPGTDSLNFDPSKNDFTVLLWVNFNSTGTRCLFGKNYTLTGNSQYDLYLSGTYISSRIGNASLQRRVPVISRANWYNIAVVNKAKTGVKMYVNGALMTGGTAKPALPSSYLVNANLLLGASHSGATGAGRANFFAGRMDEFVMFGRALSDKEIQGQYKMGMP